MSWIPECPEVQENLTEYLEGTLPFRKRAGIWLHLRICAACNAVRNALLVLPGLSKRAMEAPAEAPPDAKDALLLVLGRLKGAGKG